MNRRPEHGIIQDGRREVGHEYIRKECDDLNGQSPQEDTAEIGLAGSGGEFIGEAVGDPSEKGDHPRQKGGSDERHSQDGSSLLHPAQSDDVVSGGQSVDADDQRDPRAYHEDREVPQMRVDDGDDTVMGGRVDRWAEAAEERVDVRLALFLGSLSGGSLGLGFSLGCRGLKGKSSSRNGGSTGRGASWTLIDLSLTDPHQIACVFRRHGHGARSRGSADGVTMFAAIRRPGGGLLR